MTSRTFQQHGQAYGTQQTTINVVLDGVSIYSGPVNTVNAPLPSLPDPSYQVDNVLYSFERDTTFSGTAELSIEVNGSPLLLCQTLANYPVDQPGQADIFTKFYSYKEGEDMISDPFSNERIDSVAMSRSHDPLGQWWWTIMPGSTFAATINIQPSAPPPPPPSQ
jgi:hypothetical protein